MLSDILEELKLEEFDLSSLGYTNAEIEALLTPYIDFNWEDFDEYLEQETNLLFAAIQIKIRSEIKEVLKTSIKKYAIKNNLEDNDPAILTGKVFCHLLGVDQ